MRWDEQEAAQHPLWLITLADLTLLLLGFFVLLQANQRLDPKALAAGIRAGFGAHEIARPPIPVEMAVVEGFTPGSATPLETAHALTWAREATRDPRTHLQVTGEVDGSPGDVDGITGSGPILAVDRAREVATLLVRSGAISPGRIGISTGTSHRRVVLTLGFDGGRQ